MGLSDEEKERFEERFRVSLLNSYGMTETVSGVTCAPLVGEICVHGVPGRSLVLGYYQDEEAYVQRRPGSGLTEEEITEYCVPRLAKFKIPTIVAFDAGQDVLGQILAAHPIQIEMAVGFKKAGAGGQQGDREL